MKLTCSKLTDRLGPSLTIRYHHTSSLVSRRASVLTWIELRGCMRSFRRLLLHRISAQEKPLQLEKTTAEEKQRGLKIAMNYCYMGPKGSHIFWPMNFHLIWGYWISIFKHSLHEHNFIRTTRNKNYFFFFRKQTVFSVTVAITPT